MLNRIRDYFAEFSRDDWELLAQLLFILIMVLIIPFAWFMDYTNSGLRLWLVDAQKTLTEIQQNWWAWVLDKLSSLW